MKKNGSKTNGWSSSHSRFPIPNHRFFIAPLLYMCLFVCGVFAADTVNYDTAWTFVYDGGKDSATGRMYNDKFFDIKSLPNGVCVCIGSSAYTGSQSLMMKLDTSGKILYKKRFVTSNTFDVRLNAQSAHSLFIMKNGDHLVGGERYNAPWIMRLDSLGNIKSTYWYYDSTKGSTGLILNGSGTINSIRETSNGRIICAIGDEFPFNNGRALSNYAAILEFDSTLKFIKKGEWKNEPGYEMSGFSIEEAMGGLYLIAGNQTVVCVDTGGNIKWYQNYTFWLEGVGTKINNITRAKMLRDGRLMVCGQAYEGNCWNSYGRLYYDAWWTPITYGGSKMDWDTAGEQGGSDGLYDFCQLNDGKIAFVGNKAFSQDGGLWVFVTDSTGKKIVWEKKYNLPGVDEKGFLLNTITPLSLCSTPDGGFTVVGTNNTYGGNYNACAFHFVPKPVETATKQTILLKKSEKVRALQTGNNVVFKFVNTPAASHELIVYNAAGRIVVRLISVNKASTSIVWDCSGAGKGLYLYKVKLSDGSFVYGRFSI